MHKRMKKNNPDYLEIELERMKICLERNNWYTSYEEYEQAGA